MFAKRQEQYWIKDKGFLRDCFKTCCLKCQKRVHKKVKKLKKLAYEERRGAFKHPREKSCV